MPSDIHEALNLYFFVPNSTTELDNFSECTRNEHNNYYVNYNNYSDDSGSFNRLLRT